jgi:hypothetical protein
LQSAFVRLSELQESVLNNLNDDNTLINSGPITVKSERTKAAISAPAKKATSAKKKATKKTTTKRK